ncbi:restriction endonuclease subunit S [uncultured Psychrobacter sp.]|uniref:restriction endonuclease subunit S n=1 Tax=uncultured Psychrobacter sp. TaxID=259303 RepID=UPI003458060C
MSELVLPEGWVKTEISNIAEVIAGGTPSSKNPDYFCEPRTGISWLTPADLTGYEKMYISHGRRDITEAGYKSSSAKLMPKGSVVFSSRAPIGYVAIAEKDLSTNQGFKSFVIPDGLSSEYLYFYLKSIKGLAESLGTGTTFKELSGRACKKLPLVMAPLSEQKVIAHTLEHHLTTVSQIQARLDAIPKLIEKFRQSVLNDAVSGKLTEEWRTTNKYKIEDKNLLKDSEKYWSIPEQWAWSRLGEHVKLINGDRGKNYPNKSEYVEEGIPFINTGHITRKGFLESSALNYITEEKFNSLKGGKISEGDLVYCLRGATMGKVARVTPYSEGAIASSLVIIRPLDSVLTDYIYYFSISPQGRELIKVFDNGSAQPNLSAKSLSWFSFPLPSIEEQEVIVNSVSKLFAHADQIEKSVAAAKARIDNLTQSILHQAFTGNLTADWREQNPDLISGDNSAETLLAKIEAEKKANKTKKKK